MARIPEAEIERLKSEVSVQRLVEAFGVELKRGGKDMLGRCPLHDDGTASLVVSPGKNLWHCFGCGVAGGPIDWVMKTRGVSVPHAVELLREGVAGGLPSSAAVLAADAAAPIEPATVRALPAPVEFGADDAQLLGQVADYYAATLKQSPEALAYLEARGITGSAAAGDTPISRILFQPEKESDMATPRPPYSVAFRRQMVELVRAGRSTYSAPSGGA